MTLAILRRLATLLAILLAMTLMIFVLQALVPSDPVRLALGPTAPLSAVIARRHELGLDQPLPVQYARFLAGLAQLDLGVSIRTHRPVLQDIAIFLPASLELAIAALALGVPIGLTYGMLAVLGRRTQLVRLALITAASLPIFFSGMLLLDLFWFTLHLLPSGGRLSLAQEAAAGGGFVLAEALRGGHARLAADAIAHLALPATTLMLPIAVGVGRTFAAALRTVEGQIYIRTARAKGLSERAIFWRHMVRNAAGPVLSIIALQIAILLGNLVIVERIFAWPGLGAYGALAIGSGDLPAIQGVSIVFAVIYIVVSALIELLQVACDPRLALRR